MAFAKWKQRISSEVHKMAPGEFMVTRNTTPRQVLFGTDAGNIYLPDEVAAQNLIDDSVAEISAHMSTNDICIDGNRTDEYTADGSVIYPYKTIAEFAAAHASDTVPLSIKMSPATYAETSDITFPNVPIVIYGNGSTISAAGHTITIPNPNFARYNLFTVANVVFNNFASGSRCAMYGGSITGNITVNSYCEFIQCQLNGGTVTVGATGQCVVSVCSPTSKFVSTGVLMFNGINMNTGNSAGYLVTSTAGFFSSANSIIYNTSTNAAAGGISCDNGATITAPNIIVNTSSITAGGGATAFGINSGTAYTQYSKNNATAANSLYALYGTHLIPVGTDIIGPSAIGIGSDATGDIYYRNAAGSLTRLGIGTTGQTLKVVGGLPTWVT
jgi:hypothetical protein